MILEHQKKRVFCSSSLPAWRRSDYEWASRLNAKAGCDSEIAHLLPVCVRGNNGDNDLSAYEVVTHPTTSAYLEAMGVISQHIVAKAPDKRGVTLRFNSVSIPDVAIDTYLQRIQRFFCCSEECFVLAMIYIDRLVQVHDGKVVLCSLNIHRILVTAVILAAKFFDDVYFSNSFYARIGGLPSSEMNVLEAHFLNLIKYNLYVSPREYEAYRRDVTLLYIATHQLSHTKSLCNMQKSNRGISKADVLFGTLKKADLVYLPVGSRRRPLGLKSAKNGFVESSQDQFTNESSMMTTGVRLVQAAFKSLPRNSHEFEDKGRRLGSGLEFEGRNDLGTEALGVGVSEINHHEVSWRRESDNQQRTLESRAVSLGSTKSSTSPQI